VCQGHKTSTHYFWTSTVSIRRARDTLCRTCVFASGGIYGSCCAFPCICGLKHRHIVFMLGWDRYGFHKRSAETYYAELVFLHPLGSMGHVVHSVHLGRETSTQYFSCFGGTGIVSIRRVSGHIMPNLWF
jgi:hypothetical protein